ncbi:MAG: MCE family protein [Leptospiraceae bacterium]|nr:MCE family protein [Leptospiraceae bacterium]MCB1201830.1 MCE family protein [Leptospiraceae bacterium]
MEKNAKTQIAVGIMVLIGMGLFFAMAVVLGRWQFGKAGYSVNVEFSFLNNIGVGAPVRIAGGIPVGYVEAVFQKDLKSFVKVRLNEDLRNKIPKKEGTQFAIFTTGMMGQKYINVTVADAVEGDEFLQDNDEWRGVDPPSIDQMMMAFSRWFDGKNGGQVVAEIMQETQKFITNLNAIAVENRSDIRITIRQARTSLTSLSRQLDDLMTKLNLLSRNFSDISTNNKKDIQIMLENMAQISRDLNLITSRINSGRGSVGKFLQNEELYVNASEAVANARDLFRSLKDKPWLIMYKDR